MSNWKIEQERIPIRGREWERTTFTSYARCHLHRLGCPSEFEDSEDERVSEEMWRAPV